jgi:hypothetical protein
MILYFLKQNYFDLSHRFCLGNVNKFADSYCLFAALLCKILFLQ